MNETSKPTASNLHFGPDEPSCNDGTIRHSWDQQRQHDIDIFADTATTVLMVGGKDLPPARRDYSFREYRCEKCGAVKQVSTEVRTAYAAMPGV